MAAHDGRVAVLHVDDDPALCRIVALTLESPSSGIDCTVTSETDPVAALSRLREDPDAFHCVVSDYQFPGMTGIEFLDAVRAISEELPVLLFSGTETTTIAGDIVEAGITDYLRKGTTPDGYTLLVRRVEHAVESTGDSRFDPGAETELEAVAVIGPDGRFERADPAYARCYGYPNGAAVVGRDWSELHPPEEVTHIREHVLPVVRGGGYWTGRSVGLRTDGSRFAEAKTVTTLGDDRLLISVRPVPDEPPNV